jgi:hypothetical protein
MHTITKDIKYKRQSNTKEKTGGLYVRPLKTDIKKR